jgi:hypothetical protein
VSVGYTVHHVEARIFTPGEEGDDLHPAGCPWKFLLPDQLNVSCEKSVVGS